MSVVFILWDKIRYWVAIWVKSRKEFRHIRLSDLSMGWSFLLLKKKKILPL